MPHFIVTCDGGSTGNHDGAVESQGYGSFLIELLNEPGKLMTRRDFGSGVTNNEAEYMALIAALEHISDSFNSVHADLKTIEISVNTDSKLVIGQLVGKFKINAANLRPLAIQAKSLMEQFSRVNFNHISGDSMKTILGH
jgi:ribonuclease HI